MNETPKVVPFITYWSFMLVHAAFARGKVQQFRGRVPVVPGARAWARAQGYSNVQDMQRTLARAARLAAA